MKREGITRGQRGHGLLQVVVVGVMVIPFAHTGSADDPAGQVEQAHRTLHERMETLPPRQRLERHAAFHASVQRFTSRPETASRPVSYVPVTLSARRSVLQQRLTDSPLSPETRKRLEGRLGQVEQRITHVQRAHTAVHHDPNLEKAHRIVHQLIDWLRSGRGGRRWPIPPPDDEMVCLGTGCPGFPEPPERRPVPR